MAIEAGDIQFVEVTTQKQRIRVSLNPARLLSTFPPVRSTTSNELFPVAATNSRFFSRSTPM
jgi:hypothetical protein